MQYIEFQKMVNEKIKEVSNWQVKTVCDDCKHKSKCTFGLHFVNCGMALKEGNQIGK